jgi:DNA ligase-4
MCFKSGLLCHLLNELERNREKNGLGASKIVDLGTRAVHSWFNDHDHIIPRQGPEAVAFLSCPFPERRTDRVFELQERRLEPIIK